MRQAVINTTLRSAAAGYKKLFLAILNARPRRDEDAEKILNLRKTVAPTGEPVRIFEDACLVETLTGAVQDKNRLDRLLKDYREFCSMAEKIVNDLKARRAEELEKKREWARQAQAAEEERLRRLRWEETHVNSKWGHIRNKFDFVRTLYNLLGEDKIKQVFIKEGWYLWSDEQIQAERFNIEATVWIDKEKYAYPTVLQRVKEREAIFLWSRNNKENDKVKQAFHLLYKAFETPEEFQRFANNPLDAGINFIRLYGADWDSWKWCCTLKYTDPADRLLQEAYKESTLLAS